MDLSNLTVEQAKGMKLVATGFVWLLWTCGLSLPLAIWKIIDIVVWASNHVYLR